MVGMAGILESLKWVIGITIGASIGSVIATRITFRQFENKFDVKLEDTATSLRKLCDTIEKWDEFRKSEEAEILLKVLTQKFLGGDLTDERTERKG